MFIDENKQKTFLVMEHFAGKSLRDIISETKGVMSGDLFWLG
jgi:tRNA A-37 threonylcarbamoyl transferase component Bud32